MTDTPHDLAAANAQRAAARDQLYATLGTVQERLSPSNLAHDTFEAATNGVATAARKGAEAVRTRPVAAAAIAGGIGLFLARGWISGIFRKRNHETPAVPEGLVTQDPRATRANKGQPA